MGRHELWIRDNSAIIEGFKILDVLERGER
jgi:hypothetical protein